MDELYNEHDVMGETNDERDAVVEVHYNKHYITVDGRGRITDGWSDGPNREKDTAGAICINEQGA